MAKKSSFAWFSWLLILAVLGGGAAAGYWYWKKPANNTPTYRTEKVSRGDIVQSVTANGQINPIKSVLVGSQISGIIKEIRADFNSLVKSGDVIAQIDPATYELSVKMSQADLTNAAASLELAQLNYKRASELRKNELISAAEADKALVDLHQAEAVVIMREATLNKSKVDLERTTILAPINGVVILRNVDVGQTVAASFNTPTLFQIANDLKKMQIELMVSEADVGGVDVGQQVNFSVDAFPGRQFSGLVKQVRFNPITNQNVVTYTTIVEVNNDELKLRPGMTATASVITARKAGALRIPNAALRFRPPPTVEVLGGTNVAGASTNKPSAGRLASADSPGMGRGGSGSGDGQQLTPEERRRRFESMSPEERAAMRERRGRLGEGGPPGGGGFGGSMPRSSSDGPVARTVYLMASNSVPNKILLKAVTIKTGITDGAYTEVLDGLKEGETIVSGSAVTSAAGATMAGRPSTPFGSPFGGMRPR